MNEIEKRVDFLEEHSKEFNKLVLKAENELYIKELLKRNIQLQSNWNSLREYCEENKYFYSGYQGEDREEDLAIMGVLDKMNELEGKNKE